MSLLRRLVYSLLVAGVLASVAVGVASAGNVASATTAGDTVDAPSASSFGGTGVVQAEEDEAEDEEDEEGVAVLGDWWGLGEEADEAPYIGLAELGVVLLVVGVGGYSVGKRTSVVPVQYRRHLLQSHEWTVLVGTALTVPHFLFVEEWEGLGLAVAVLLAVEVLSGLYGRHLHRHVVRLGRGTETAPLAGRALDVTKETVFSRWRWIHVSLTLVTAVVLLLHVLTAVGD